ncbi:MerR family transcriptional regulator [Fulvivirgaceae bacterium BMA12]|uniref:MerR family transcriptional regulator n=1 Tax=Agaribacillus aureus TaxID=3051825 RepID=A0ABT8L3A8_9BACT|nr:MerR family transcriptional regulator [Fulvivirgaceae bacterium BMA12]
MGRYSINDIEKLSGIKAHTIRIWEKRHKVVEPKRTSSNIRYYDDQDLKRVLNISFLNNQGLKISAIASMQDDELHEKVVQLSRNGDGVGGNIERMIVSMIELDERMLEKLFSEFTMKYGFEDTIVKIVFPFLKKIGVLWQTGNISPAHEHFISNLLRQKIIVAIDALPTVDDNRTKILFYLPDGELHELGLLFYHYVAKKNNLKTIYLGQSLPYADLLAVSKLQEPDLIFTSYISPLSTEALNKQINRLLTDFADKTILLSGYQVMQNNLSLPDSIVRIADAKEFKHFLLSIQ